MSHLVSSAAVEPSVGLCVSNVAVQVPDVLIAVCCSMAQHSRSQGVTAATMAAFTALNEFFHSANDKGGFLFKISARGDVDSSITTNSADSSSALSLAPGIRSQVLQSGLMGAFAAAMAAATDVLIRHPPQPGADDQPATQPSTPTSTAAASAGHSAGHFTSLLQSWQWVCRLWPAGREQVAAIAVAAPAAVQLLATIIRVVSRDLPAALTAAAAVAAPQSRRSEGRAGTSGAVDSAKHYAGSMCYAVYGVQQTLSWLSYCVFVLLESRDVGMPELRPVLAMPEFTTGLATMVLVLTQALLAQQRLGPTAAATSTHNTSSRSSSSNDGVRGATGSSRPLPSNSSIPSTVNMIEVMSSLLNSKMTRKLEAMLRNMTETCQC